MYKTRSDEPFEDKVSNQRKFPKREFCRAMKALDPESLQLTHPGFLLTTGDRGKLLIGPVSHDGDVYSRQCQRRGPVFGSIKLLRRFGMNNAVLMTKQQVIQMALNLGNYRRLRCTFSGQTVDVAMLHGDLRPKDGGFRTCGIYLLGGAIHPLTPEWPVRTNTWQQCEPVEELNDGVLEHALRKHLKDLPNT